MDLPELLIGLSFGQARYIRDIPSIGNYSTVMPMEINGSLPSVTFLSVRDGSITQRKTTR